MKQPQFKFAVSEKVKSMCPFQLDGKTLESTDFLPTRGRHNDTGYDLRCAETKEIELMDGKKVLGFEIEPYCYFRIDLGVRMLPEAGWWLSLAPRSSTFMNLNIHALYGVIDEGYENSLCFAGIWINDRCRLISANGKFVIQFGQKIAQVIPKPRYDMVVEAVDNETIEQMFRERGGVRGTGGFGSSGTV